MMDPVITIRDLRMSFGDNHVLQGFNLTLRDQENLVLIGKSGSGKSVLLKCIIGLNTADSGELIVLGKKVAELSQEELNALRANVGFLFQGSALYDSMTVRENLEFPLRRHLDRVDPARIDDLILSTLESVGLAKAIDLMPAELSGGMKRRVALARTIILRPKIILYDEPTSGLDPITAKEIAQLILDIQDKYQTASLIITHDLDFARSISQHIVLLVDGVDYAMGSYDELSTSSDPSISAFFK
ncbi:MAG: ATP-binding cassette domain-containing protein [Saprospiraceae bacterium]|nr:ATP-binding cassette domain-containing protein [Saprospiraceae bacterium]